MNRTKIFLKIAFLLVCLIAGSITAAAYDFESGGIYYKIDSGDSTLTVTYGSSTTGTYSGDVVIPRTVDYNDKHYIVTTIGSTAFYKCTGLTSIYIPSTVKTLNGSTGHSGVYGCHSNW